MHQRVKFGKGVGLPGAQSLQALAKGKKKCSFLHCSSYETGCKIKNYVGMLHEMIPNQFNASEHHTALHARRHKLNEVQLHLSVPFNSLNEFYHVCHICYLLPSLIPLQALYHPRGIPHLITNLLPTAGTPFDASKQLSSY